MFLTVVFVYGVFGSRYDRGMQRFEMDFQYSVFKKSGVLKLVVVEYYLEILYRF